MSTIVVVKKADKVAIAADTMTSYGSTICTHKYLSNSNKILNHGGSYLGFAGSSAHGSVFGSIVRKYSENLSFDNADDIFETYLRLHPILKDEYYIKTDEGKDDSYESSQMDALIANPYGIFGMYSWREVEEYNRFWAIGSGWQFALGAMYAAFDNLETAEEIAKIGIEAGCEFDDGSALPYTIYTVPLINHKK